MICVIERVTVQLHCLLGCIGPFFCHSGSEQYLYMIIVLPLLSSAELDQIVLLGDRGTQV